MKNFLLLFVILIFQSLPAPGSTTLILESKIMKRENLTLVVGELRRGGNVWIQTRNPGEENLDEAYLINDHFKPQKLEGSPFEAKGRLERVPEVQAAVLKVEAVKKMDANSAICLGECSLSASWGAGLHFNGELVMFGDDVDEIVTWHRAVEVPDYVLPKCVKLEDGFRSKAVAGYAMKSFPGTLVVAWWEHVKNQKLYYKNKLAKKFCSPWERLSAVHSLDDSICQVVSTAHLNCDAKSTTKEVALDKPLGLLELKRGDEHEQWLFFDAQTFDQFGYWVVPYSIKAGVQIEKAKHFTFGRR